MNNNEKSKAYILIGEYEKDGTPEGYIKKTEIKKIAWTTKQ